MNEELEVMRVVLENSEQIVMICRKGGNNLSFSAAAEKVFGPPRFIGLQADDAERYGIFYPGTSDLIPTYDLPMARALKGQTVRDVLISVRRPGEPEYLISVNAGPMRDGKGNFHGGLLVGSILEVRASDADGTASAAVSENSLQSKSSLQSRTSDSHSPHTPKAAKNPALLNLRGNDIPDPSEQGHASC